MKAFRRSVLYNVAILTVVNLAGNEIYVWKEAAGKKWAKFTELCVFCTKERVLLWSAQKHLVSVRRQCQLSVLEPCLWLDNRTNQRSPCCMAKVVYPSEMSRGRIQNSQTLSDKMPNSLLLNEIRHIWELACNIHVADVYRTRVESEPFPHAKWEAGVQRTDLLK